MQQQADPTPTPLLPTVIAVGPPRTGTTWLYSVLRGHVGLSSFKETDFFSTNYSNGLNWYRTLFTNPNSSLPNMEIAPNYFSSAEARDRIAHHIPTCRIICTVRDPVDRAYSHYRMLYHDGWVRYGFEETIASSSLILESSKYASHLLEWRARFGKENVFVAIYDDLVADPQDYLDRICDFIGISGINIEGSSKATQRVYHISHHPRSATIAGLARKLRHWMEMDNRLYGIRFLEKVGFWSYCFEGGRKFAPLAETTQKALRRQFKTDIDALEALIQRDLSLWKKGTTSGDNHPSSSTDSTYSFG
jgi:hypothetical protein